MTNLFNVIGWVALTVNVALAALNGVMSFRLRTRSKELDQLIGKWNTKHDDEAKDDDVAFHQHMNEYHEMVAFCIMVANVPGGILPRELQEMAKAAIPPGIEYKVNISNLAPPKPTLITKH